MARKDRKRNMSLDFDIFEIDWAKKGNGNGCIAYGTDVYLSVSNHTDRNSVFVSFRNNKLPREIEYIQMARIGDLILFKESTWDKGWKLNFQNSLTKTRNIHPSMSVIPKDILELIKKHNHEGFDLQYDAKHNIYYIDTTKRVEE